MSLTAFSSRHKLDRQHRRNKIVHILRCCLVDVQHREQRTTEQPVADADDVELRLVDVVVVVGRADVAGTHTDEQCTKL